MRDPLINFNWDTLCSEYDKHCHGFDPDSPHLGELKKALASDRDLYSVLIERIGEEFRKSTEISYCSYRAMVYWKLYSQPIALTNTVDPLATNPQKTQVESNLKRVRDVLPVKVKRDSVFICRLIESVGDLQLPAMTWEKAYPVRSTLLHFLYPNDIPVFDIMVLQAVGVEDKKANHDLSYFKRYLEHAWYLEQKHRKALSAFPGLSTIRVLDMALWVNRGKQVSFKKKHQAECSSTSSDS